MNSLRSKFSRPLILAAILAGIPLAAPPEVAGRQDAEAGESLNVLFIGNSYTGRHRLAELVKEIAEASRPGLEMNVTTVIYGGRRLADHWRLGTANFVRLHELTAEEQHATVAALEAIRADNPQDRHIRAALQRHRALLPEIEKQRQAWDVVVLQSYRDDLEGAESPYAEYAPKFAGLARGQGARTVLYETSPDTQNAAPLAAAPDPAPVFAKAKALAALADRIDAAVAPMSLIALKCQTGRPDLTLRFVNDAHLNHTMAYLSACAIHAAIFDESPEGTPVDSVTDIRFFNDTEPDKDRDGGPITRVFTEGDRADMQRFVREGREEFARLRQAAR